MKPVRFVMVGGFLGAGKTTMIGRLARHYQSRGLKVGVITNDQAENLVDTHALRAQGFASEEIPGGCFCCRFDALTEAAGKLAAADRPDVLLAEPVGSCTDLIATVVQPLKRLYADRYEVAPYVVLIDPSRALRILTGSRFGGFSAKVVYIFDKQLEEADAIAINKVDTLTAADKEKVVALLRKQYPQKEILTVSARTGAGLEELVGFVEGKAAAGRNIPKVDYDLYAEGEAELGWLNSTARLTADQPFSPDDFLLRLGRALQEALASQEVEAAHLKMLVQTGQQLAIANLVRGDAAPELSQRAETTTREADLIINARVHVDPTVLRATVEHCLSEACRNEAIQWHPGRTQHFKPGWPVPTHRYAEAV